ncbi:gluconate 2-dehydrogenase subunit 3 family protein [Sphingobacterium sp. LRF_L2]|uniref:gluconate 2-dehydrogenase subunit 3 family protein n=1 Tax=Sphingobacterium sp. LRF_L2 TaxID=3369421 RepID=UPI003F60D52D
MNRRLAIKQLFVLAGGMMIATSCSTGGDTASIALHTIKLTASDEKLLSELVEAILPKTDSPGGKELNLHLFVMKMVDDCQSPEDQKAFLDGLKEVSKLSGKPATELVAYLNSRPADDLFVKILKQRTIQGYLNSEYVMKNKLKYELIPGRYDGAVKVNA